MLQSADGQVVERVDRTVMQADFVMAVWRRRAPGAADRADLFAARDLLTDLHINSRHVAVAGRDAVTVINHDDVAVPTVNPGINHNAIRR